MKLAARKLIDLLRPIVNGWEPPNPHWFSDRSGAYCRSCAEKIDPSGKKIDGGWFGEEDGPIYCETCGCLLDFTLTDYGTRQTLDGFIDYGHPASNRDDAYTLLRVLGADGVPILTESCGGVTWAAELRPQVEEMLRIQNGSPRHSTKRIS